MTSVLLSGGCSGDGRALALRLDPAAGTVLAAAPALEPAEGEDVVDCTGMVLLEAPVEPHAHLDKALTAGLAPNPRGDLLGAIDAWHALAATLEEDEILERGRAAALELVARGTTTIRSHVDVGSSSGERGLRALVRLRDELAAEGLAVLQLAALPAIRDGADMRALLEAAVAAGADVVGGCPQIHPDPEDCVAAAVETAAAHGLAVDLHMDEALAPERSYLGTFVDAVSDAGLGGRAVASHCVSLGTMPEADQADLAARAAAAGVAVIALPQTNLFLQARDRPVAPPRGLTAIAALRAAGAVVAAGADNVRDPFCTMGRSDALETAALLVMAAHLTPEEAWAAVSSDARRAIGAPAAPLEPGAPAEVLAVRGTSLADAVARGSEERIVIHRGRVVAQTSVATEIRHSPQLAGRP